MGVRGLTTYITYNEDLFLKDFLLHDSSLVVDGHSLCAQLYRNLNCFSAFGGDYDKFAASVRKFFLSLRRCNVSSYVLFDGSHEKRKLRTAFSRLRSKLSGAARLYPGNQASLQIFPLLLRDVFKEVLVDLKVPHTVCEFEADDEIAALARHLSCPVLSYDSDFFIYNVLYIPFNTLNVKPVAQEEVGTRMYAMECKIYRVENFLNHFGGLKEDLLPLFATLLGNDYVEKKVFRNFFSHLKLPKSRKKKNDQQRSIQALLEWLRNETLESAVVKIIGRLKKTQKQRVLMIINKTCSGYNQRNCESLKYFNLEMVVTEEANVLNVPEDTQEAALVSDDDSEEESSTDDSASECSSEVDLIDANALQPELPATIINAIRNGLIPQQYINMYTHALYFCIPQVEDYTDLDSFLGCLPLLRYAFDMLTNFSERSLTYIGREVTKYKRFDVPVEISIKPPFQCQSSPLEDDKLGEYFNIFLINQLPGLDVCSIEALPPNFRLAMISTLWWAKHCNITLAQVYSVFLCHIFLEVVDDKTGSFRGDHYFNNKYGKKLEEIKNRVQQEGPVLFDRSQLFLNKNKVLYEDCLIAASVMLKLFDMDNEMKKRPKIFDVRRIHGFAQFQCCLQQFNYLNTLCNCKYEPSKFYKTFNGTLAYNILNKLCDRTDLILFIEQYLKGADTVILFFKSLCVIFENNMKSVGATLAVPRTRGRRGGRRRGRKEISFLCEAFESEVII